MSNFNFIKNGDWGTFLNVSSENLTETVAYIKQKDIRNFELNDCNGYELSDISFLNEIAESVEGLIVIGKNISLKGIENYHNLKMLNITDEHSLPVNFTNFKKLERCSILWHNNISNLSACKMLRELNIKKLKLSGAGKNILYETNNIHRLTLIQSKLDNLDFIKTYMNIRSLELYYMPKIRDIDTISYCSKTLEKLVLDNCRNIQDYDSIKSLKKIEYLMLNNNKEIESLAFIKDLQNLKHLSFVGTNVLDGNISICKAINYVGFNNKRHYSHKFEEINEY